MWLQVPWCLCGQSGFHAGTAVPPGSAWCRRWLSPLSKDPILTAAVQTGFLEKGDKECPTPTMKWEHDQQLETPPGNREVTSINLWNNLSPADRNVPPGTCSMKILMYLFSETEPRYWTMFLCFRYLCRAISSWSGCEYLHHREESTEKDQKHVCCFDFMCFKHNLTHIYE